jgi:hypothetical protein
MSDTSRPEPTGRTRGRHTTGATIERANGQQDVLRSDRSSSCKFALRSRPKRPPPLVVRIHQAHISNQNTSWRPFAWCRLFGALHDYKRSRRRASPAPSAAAIRSPPAHPITRMGLVNADLPEEFRLACCMPERGQRRRSFPCRSRWHLAAVPLPARLVVPLRPLRFGARNAQQKSKYSPSPALPTWVG